MLIHAAASIPVKDKSLVVALREFTEFVRQYLSARSDSDICVTIFEPGARSNLALALALPSDTKEFFLTLPPGGAPLAAGQFHQTVTASKPKNTRSSINLKASVIPDLPGLLDAIAEKLPASGRGIMIMVVLRGWSIAGEAGGTLVDASLSRFRHGARDISAGVGLRFQALSLKDPAVKETIARASAKMKLKFAEPLASFGLPNLASRNRQCQLVKKSITLKMAAQGEQKAQACANACLRHLTEHGDLPKLHSVPVSMRFVVKVGNDIVGFSEPEGGDPPMGMACGKLLPTEASKSIQQHCNPEALQPIPNLTVEVEGGRPIEHGGPVQVIDFGPKYGEGGIQIFVDGIPCPLYGELFPQHVGVYRNQFK
jgi:hypothetical protein